MALPDRQFQALQANLQKKKDSLGEEKYSEFTSKIQSKSQIEERSFLQRLQQDGISPTFEADLSDTGLQAGLKAAGNVPSSAANLGVNLTSAITQPIQTGKGILDTVRGLGAKVTNKLSDVTGIKQVGVEGGQVKTETFDALAESLKSRYGSLEAAQKTATEDPVGFGADIAGILSGTGAVSKITSVNKAGVGAIKTPIATKLDDVAVGQVQKAINLNPSDIRKIKQPNVAGKDPAEWLLERDFKGSQDQIVNKLNEHSISSKQSIDDGLANINVQVSKADVEPATKTLKVLKETFDGTIGNEEFAAQIDNMLNKDSYTLTELNDIKRMSDNYINIFRVNGTLKDSATAQGLMNVRQQLKGKIEDVASENGFENVRDLNKETQVAREISNAIQKRLDVESKLPNLGLRDAVIATGGLATGGIGAAAGLVVSKKILESAAFRTHLAGVLKQADPKTVSELNQAVQTNNVTKVAQFLTPIINEYENSIGTEENLESGLSELEELDTLE